MIIDCDQWAAGGFIPAIIVEHPHQTLGLVQNWLIGPTLMFGLVVVFFSELVPGLPARPEYFLGLVFIGMARCLAMVLVWNELVEESTEYGTGTTFPESAITRPGFNHLSIVEVATWIRRTFF